MITLALAPMAAGASDSDDPGTLVFNRVTKIISKSTALGITIANGDEQIARLVANAEFANPLLVPSFNKAIDQCERSARLAMAYPGKYQFTVKYISNFTTLPVFPGGGLQFSGDPNAFLFECHLDRK